MHMYFAPGLPIAAILYFLHIQNNSHHVADYHDILFVTRGNYGVMGFP